MGSQPITRTQIDPNSPAPLTPSDLEILAEVPSSLSNGLQLQKWWEEAHKTDNFDQRFETAVTFNRPDTGFAYFDKAPLNGGQLPIMGDFTSLFFDRPKSSTEAGAIRMQEQVQEFVLKYFMRISDFRPPAPFIDEDRPPLPPWLKPFSQCSNKSDIVREGFGYKQLYYKLSENGLIGKFPEEVKFAITDVRELGQKFEWIVVDIDIFNFVLQLAPLGPNFPHAGLPLPTRQLAVLSKDFIKNEDNPEPGVLGVYGFGYATIKTPNLGVLAYGPGYFDDGFQLFDFRVRDNGDTHAELAFCVNRPTRVANVFAPITVGLSLADSATRGRSIPLTAPVKKILDSPPFANVSPVLTSINLIDLFTGGAAGRDLCISVDDFEKFFLRQHYDQNYVLITGSLLTWRQIPDWLNTAALPEWIRTGKSS